MHARIRLSLLVNFLRYLTISASSLEIGLVLSTTTMIRSDSWIDVIVCLNMSFFMLSFYFLPNRLTSTPGVSITLTRPSMIVNYLRSRVIPGNLSTMAKCSPIMQLKRVDLPEFGNPTNETLNWLSFYYLTVFHSLLLLFFLLCNFVISFYVCSINWVFFLDIEKS